MRDRDRDRDARRYHRRDVDLRATVILDGAAPVPCRIANLSVGGAFVALGAAPTIGSRIRLAFGLVAGEDVDTAATIMWSEGGNVGVRFDGLRARETWAVCTFLERLDAPPARAS